MHIRGLSLNIATGSALTEEELREMNHLRVRISTLPLGEDAEEDFEDFRLNVRGSHGVYRYRDDGGALCGMGVFEDLGRAPSGERLLYANYGYFLPRWRAHPLLLLSGLWGLLPFALDLLRGRLYVVGIGTMPRGFMAFSRHARVGGLLRSPGLPEAVRVRVRALAREHWGERLEPDDTVRLRLRPEPVDEGWLRAARRAVAWQDYERACPDWREGHVPLMAVRLDLRYLGGLLGRLARRARGGDRP